MRLALQPVYPATPEAWLSIIEGFATETSRRPEVRLFQMLEDALYGREGAGGGSTHGWLEELLTLAEALTAADYTAVSTSDPVFEIGCRTRMNKRLLPGVG